MCLYADFVWERVFNMIFIWFSLFFMTSMLEKTWWIICVFSVGLHIALFASSSVWHQFVHRIFIDFRHILTPLWRVLRIKMGMKMNGDFHIDFLTKFDVLLTPFGSIQGHFGVPWGHLGGKMEAKEHARFVPKWGPAPQGASDPPRISFRRYLGLIFGGFWTFWDMSWDAFGRPFWQVFC